MADKITTSQAEDSLKQISKEAIALEASSIISLYEIDLSQVKLNLNLNSSTVFGDAGLPEGYLSGVRCITQCPLSQMDLR